MTTDDEGALLAIVRGDQTAAAGDQVHERVLDGALAAFLDFGIRRTSINEIARRSGVSPASLYRWYGTKDALVAAVGIRETQRFLAEVEAGVDVDAPPDEQLAEVSVQVARRLRHQPLLRRLIETEPESILPRLTTDAAPIIEAGTAYLTTHIERLMDAGVVERFDPRPLAEMLARVSHSMLLTPAAAPQDDDAIRAAAREPIRWLLHLPPRRSP
ncbi:MAG TPA: TetR/AcrR family transcriptional regulator [Acidimicrobiales bacterium]|nr:TetR/AcrR family transcriptional regulator [Acidimicrobiales bacterium]